MIDDALIEAGAMAFADGIWDDLRPGAQDAFKRVAQTILEGGLEGRVPVVESVLGSLRRERDYAHSLLRIVRKVSDLPDPLHRAINGAVALEGEGDTEDAAKRADELMYQIFHWSKAD